MFPSRLCDLVVQIERLGEVAFYFDAWLGKLGGSALGVYAGSNGVPIETYLHKAGPTLRSSSRSRDRPNLHLRWFSQR